MEYFERFANKICEYCMTNYVIPYLKEHGYIMSYRAEIKGKNTSAKTMQIQKPYDTQITVPYGNSASSLMTGDQCVVFALGDTSNSIVVSDGKLQSL